MLALTIASDFDGAAADGAGYAKKFSGQYSHRIFKGIGHNVPQEAPPSGAKDVWTIALAALEPSHEAH
jgi:hypothetical protein